jgi:hypothetical protein
MDKGLLGCARVCLWACICFVCCQFFYVTLGPVVIVKVYTLNHECFKERCSEKYLGLAV